MSILLVLLFATHIYAFDYSIADLSIEGRMYGSEDAGEHEFPYHVHLFADENNTDHAICGGAILNEWFILTAAHCLNDTRNFPRMSRVGVGSATLKAARIMNVDKFIIHEKYDAASRHDIGLIKLAEPLVLDGVTMKAAVLPEQDEEPTSSKATAIGAGRRSQFGAIATILQKMTTELTECHLGRLRTGAHFLCISQGIQKGLCHGDSGSPLLVDGKVVGELNGQLGSICFKRTSITAYTKVSSYRSWIDLKMKTE